VQWGTATKKFSAGFNLRDLWIGSEGGGWKQVTSELALERKHTLVVGSDLFGCEATLGATDDKRVSIRCAREWIERA
jgi:hypothetical protein